MYSHYSGPNKANNAMIILLATIQTDESHPKWHDSVTRT